MWSRDWGGRVFLFYTLSCCSHIMQPIRDDVMLQHTAGERQWRVRGRRGGGALSFIYLFRLNFGSNRKQKRETRSDKNHVKFKMFPESRWRLNMRQNLKTRFRFYSNQRFKKEKTGIRSKKTRKTRIRVIKEMLSRAASWQEVGQNGVLLTVPHAHPHALVFRPQTL